MSFRVMKIYPKQFVGVFKRPEYFTVENTQFWIPFLLLLTLMFENLGFHCFFRINLSWNMSFVHFQFSLDVFAGVSSLALTLICSSVQDNCILAMSNVAFVGWNFHFKCTADDANLNYSKLFRHLFARLANCKEYEKTFSAASFMKRPFQ